MNLLNTLSRLVGLRGYSQGQEPGGANCPHESEILKYIEGTAAPLRRARLEKHFTGCEDCREFLALSAYLSREQVGDMQPLSDEAVNKQTARVLAFIERDDLNTSKAKQGAQRETVRRDGFFLPYPQLAAVAMVICAIAAGIAFWLIRDNRPEAAMQSLKLAMKDERRSPARISGGLEYSPYSVTRGEEDSDELQFSRALNQLKYAESESAPAEARLALARVYLARGSRDEAKKAIAILESLAARAEALNDLGVAEFQLGNYNEAITRFDAALEKSPNFTEALFNKALAEERAGRYSDAQRDWEQFISQSSDEKWKAEARRHLKSSSGQ